jgi:glutaredoxin
LVIGVAGVMALIFALRSPPDVEPVVCERDLAPSDARVIMLGTGWCPDCARARAYFRDEAVAYCEYDLERSAVGADMYRDSGETGIPVILIGDQEWVGFDRGSIERALLN